MKNVLFILLLFLINPITYAQLKDKPHRFAHLNKNSLVQNAKEILAPSIESKGGTLNSFGFSAYQIQVFVNAQQQWVHFNLPIKYLPCNTSYYGNIAVELKSGSVSYQHISNPKDSKKEPVFYSPPDQAKKAILFVIAALNKSESDSINPADFTDEILIADQENFYRVIIQSAYYYLDYKIEKGTGVILDQAHEELIPMPESEEEKLFEIK